MRLRQNWAESPNPHLQIMKETMIPTGKYELKFYIKSETNGSYMNTDLNFYQLGNTAPVSIKPTSNTWTERTYELEVSEPTFLNLSFGFITSAGNSPASVWVDDVTLTYHVSQVKIGDVNNDGYVNIADVTCMVSYILGNTPPVFIRKAADINNDDVINITDVTALVELILNAN